MKRIFLIFALIYFNILGAQEKKVVYLYFDEYSDENCEVYKDGGGYLIQKKYKKIKSTSNKINYRFYICKELFLFQKESFSDTCKVEQLDEIKLSRIEDLKKIVDKKNPLYPFKVFEKVYLIEKMNDSTIVKYDVKWQYYIN